jgi:hypothetical protein
MGVGDYRLDAAQAAPRQLPEEGRPEGFGLGGADIQCEHLTPAVCGIDADRNDDSDRDDAAGLADGSCWRLMAAAVIVGEVGRVSWVLLDR